MGIASFNLDSDEISVAQRERAANLLKETPLFRNFSRRLLIDVVERSIAGRLKDKGAHFLDSFIDEQPLPKDIVGGITRGQILAIVVLKGTLIVANKPQQPRQAMPSPIPPEEDWPPGFESATELSPGVYLRNSRLFGELNLGDFRMEPARDEQVDLLVVSSAMLDAPTPAWTINLQAVHSALVPTIMGWQRPELIWVTAAACDTATAEALTHVVAGKIATDHPKEPMRLAILSPHPQFLQWQDGRFTSIVKAHSTAATSSAKINAETLLQTFFKNRDVRGRLFVLHTFDTQHPPEGLKRQFDRVVYLTEEFPDELPKEMHEILREEVLDPPTAKDPAAHLSSFLPVVLHNTNRKSSAAKRRRFKAGELPKKKAKKVETSDAFMKHLRDSVIVPFDYELFADTWKQWEKDGGTTQSEPFLAAAVGSGAISDTILGSWGRAVMNRRVGVACSGGGASAYRLGPLLQMFENHTPERVPIDVLVGLSGSALIGAFYSRWGMEGFELARRLRFFFQATMPLLTLWTYPYEVVVDYLLDNARVEDLDIRFAAVAAALPETEPPRATVVVNGTLGEAVRASGTLPPSFAPTDKYGIRYTDGGAGTAVPAQVARDCGADVVLACNVIPGPKRGNPFGNLLFGRFLHNIPVFGRMLDGYMWNAFFWSQTSKEFGDSADVFVDFEPQAFPMIESSYFMFANLIIAQAEGEKAKLEDCVDLLDDLWKKL